MNVEQIQVTHELYLRDLLTYFTFIIAAWLLVLVLHLGYVPAKAVKGLRYSEGKLFMGIMGLGLVARLLNLGGNALWFDESITAFTAKADFNHMLQSVILADHPPLYFIMEWLWYRLWPFTIQPSEWWLRFPSLVFGTGNIGLMFLVARAFGLKKQERLMATFIMAVSPFQLQYSQEARMYQLLLSGFLVTAYGYKTERWWLFNIGGIASMYTQNLGGALGLATLGLLGLSERKFKPIGIGVMVIGGAFSPWLVYGLSQQLERVGQGFWIPPVTLGTVLSNYYMLIWAQLTHPPILAIWPGTIITLLVLMLAFWQGRHHKAILAVANLPVLLCVAISVLFVPVLIPRVLISATPGLYMLLALLLSRSRRWVGAVMLTMLVMVLFNFYTDEMKFDSRQTANVINQHEGAIVYTSNFLPLYWYLPERESYFLPVVQDDITTRYNLNDPFFKALGVTHTNTQLSNLSGQVVVIYSLGVNVPQVYRDFYNNLNGLELPLADKTWLKVITR